MAEPHILLVEDDVKLADILQEYLAKQGFKVSWVGDGALAPERILSEAPELVILDLMLPGLDGLSICRQVRSQYAGQILMLTANDDDMDQVAALELGVDDYVCKPLQPRVLLARIRMLLRRPVQSSEASSKPLDSAASRERCFGRLALHSSLRRCTLAGLEIDLTPGEFDVLWLLSSKPDEIYSREALTMDARGIEYDGQDRTIDNRIASLRKKLEADPNKARGIITVRGKGYRFVPDQW